MTAIRTTLAYDGSARIAGIQFAARRDNLLSMVSP
jgi:hypothetical protein